MANAPTKDNFDGTRSNTDLPPDGDREISNPNAVPTIAESNTPTAVHGTATAAAAPTNSSINETTTSAAPRAKINISLKRKSRPTSSASSIRYDKKSSASTLLAEEYTTIAEEAEIISQRRKEEGSVLVIPCKQDKHKEEEQRKKQPLLAGRLALLRKQQDEGGATDGGGIEAKASCSSNDDFVSVPEIAGTSIDEIDDDAVMKQLIQSAGRTQGGIDTTEPTTPGGKMGLVIAAPLQNKLNTARGNDNDDSKVDNETKRNGIALNDEDEQFKRELSHHAADVDPTSNAYANVAISDFGSALLRGMGWSGGSASVSATHSGRKLNESGGGEEAIKPRPHRLGLGATPLMPLPSSGGGGGLSGRPANGTGSTIHRRARRPEEVKRDEERQRQQEEVEKREEERRRLDVQFTLQKGSIVHVSDQDVDANGLGGSCSKRKMRAVVIRTAGVPGLNRILIQMEGAARETSVTKHSVALCSWEELETYPFRKRLLQGEKEQQSPRVRGKETENRTSDDQKRSGSDSREVREDERCGQMKDGRRSDGKNRHHSSDDDNSTVDSRHHRSKDHKRTKTHHSDRDRSYHRRSRSRSDSRERSNKRRKESSASRKVQHGGRQDRRRDRSRSPVDEKYQSSHHSKRTKQSHPTPALKNSPIHWLIPNIRVRLISKKIPKYHLQKGVVQDVLRTTTQQSSSGGPKAILLMDNGQVLDKVPERYLETALPKSGGNVIILEGKEIWKKGRLLERSSKDGMCIIQLEDDLEVVNVSLDSVAEWCGCLE